MKLRLGFFGTPDFSARFLEKLISDKDLPTEIVLVITQPDKPIGRKQVMTPSPVKQIAQNNKIAIYSATGGIHGGPPKSVSSESDAIFGGSERQDPLQNLLERTDLALLYAYGEIIPSDLLRAPKYGFWNIHPSLLPLYRGASPMAYPLLLGDNKTGVTLMQMDEELDHGPIIAQEKYEILPTDKRPDLEIKLTDLGYDMFKRTLFKLTTTDYDQLQLISQQHDKATYTRRLTKQDGFIPLSILKKALNNDPLTFDELPEIIKEYYSNNKKTLNSNSQILNSGQVIYNFFRGLYPWPGIWTLLRSSSFGGQVSKRLKLTDIELKDNKLIIKKVQLEGKNEVSYNEFSSIHTLLL